MESRADFQKSADATSDPCVPFSRSDDAREQLQKRTLAGSVPSDDAEDLALPNFDRHVSQRPDDVRRSPRSRGVRERTAQAAQRSRHCVHEIFTKRAVLSGCRLERVAFS
jgi:hypothetical protein